MEHQTVSVDFVKYVLCEYFGSVMTCMIKKFDVCLIGNRYNFQKILQVCHHMSGVCAELEQSFRKEICSNEDINWYTYIDNRSNISKEQQRQIDRAAKLQKDDEERGYYDFSIYS